MLTHGSPACPSRSPSAGRCTCHITFERLVSGVSPRKPPQACLLLFGPMASCRISIERDILAVLHSRLRSSHCSSVVNGMLISAKNIGDYRGVTNFVCHVSLLRFTRECRVLSNFDGQGSVARFTGDRPASRKREGPPPTSVPSMSCMSDAVLIKFIWDTGYSLRKISSGHRMRDMA